MSQTRTSTCKLTFWQLKQAATSSTLPSQIYSTQKLSKTGTDVYRYSVRLTLNSISKFSCWCHIECTLRVTVDQRWVGTVRQQQWADFNTVLRCSFMQWRKLPEIHRIDASTMLANTITSYQHYVYYTVVIHYGYLCCTPAIQPEQYYWLTIISYNCYF